MREVDPKQAPAVQGGIAPSRQYEELPFVETLPVTELVDYNPTPLAQ